MLKGSNALHDEHVANVFRDLAGEHCAKREALEREQAWRCIMGHALVRARPRTAWLWRLALPAAVAASVTFAAVAWTHEPLLQYELLSASSSHSGEVRPESGGGSVLFSDGSRVDIGEGGELSLSVVGQHAALARLLRGELHVHVRHAQRGDWRFLAGPYEVRVVGTRFGMAWDPDSALLSIAMHEGQVRVIGPDGLDRSVVAGQVLKEVGAPPPRPLGQQESSGQALSRHADVPDKLASQPQPTKASLSSPTPAPIRRKTAFVAAPRDVAAGAARLAWPKLVLAGDFDAVVASAAGSSLDDTLRNESAQNLKALAQAARYTGHDALAVRTWLALRERFPGDTAALQAAFFLGRIYDEQGDRELAKEWLGTYLREVPEGIFAAEALGRTLTLAFRSNEHDAERAAREYLARFPSGAYAQSARNYLALPDPLDARATIADR